MAQKETLSSFTQGNFAKELSISQGKIPPNAVDFEKLIIGSCLIDKKGLDHAVDLLSPEVFYDPRHQEIFRAIFYLFSNNHPVDLMTVIQELKRTEKLNASGGDHYIIELTMGVSSSAHIEYHVRIVLEKYILRSLINISANVIDSSYKESADVFELLDKTEQSFFEVTNGTIKKGFDTANAYTVDNTNAIQVFFFKVETCIFDALCSTDHCQLAITVHFSCLFPVDIIVHIQAFYLTGKLSLEVRCIEISDWGSTTLAFEQVLPGFFGSVTNGCNSTKTCYYYSL